MPTARPRRASTTAHGAIAPSAWSARRFSMVAAIVSGEGMWVYQVFHSCPTSTAVTRSSWWPGPSGSRRTYSLLRVGAAEKSTTPR